MNNSKKLVFSTLFVGFLVVFPTAFASAETGRYFIKTNKSFWKNAIGVRQSFGNGFTADLSDFQVKLNQMMGLQIEPVRIYQILGSETLTTAVEKQVTVEKPVQAKSAKPTRPIPTDQTPWGIETIYGDPAIASTSGGDGILIAVLDTGITAHPDLKNKIQQCKDFTNYKYPVIDSRCEDKNGHGTHVAGIIAADGGADKLGIYGVAPQAKLLVYKVCANDGSCYADDVAVGIRTAVDQGVDIINMSFGGDGDSPLVHDAINYAVSKGVMLVAAAGNDGPFEASIDYPAALSSVIAVGALNQTLQVAEWSSLGINSSSKPFTVEEKDIEFAAPGVNIESTYKNNGYMILSGTSMASPFVAGLAAKFWQADDEKPAAATREYLHSIATDILPVGDDNGSGFGLPQIRN